MFMNLFKFNLFKFCSWTCSWTCSNSTCSSFVQISSCNLNMFINSSWTVRLVHEHVHQKKKTVRNIWTCSWTVHEHVNKGFSPTCSWTRDFLQLVHEQKFGFKTLFLTKVFVNFSFFILTEDCSTTAKLTGLGNTRKLFKIESFRGPQQAWFHFVHSTVKFENRENKKTFDERNGESDRNGDRSSSFIVNKARISVHLQLQFNSLRKGVVCLEEWIWQVMVWSIITWETSTMVPHCLARHRTAPFTYMSD